MSLLTHLPSVLTHIVYEYAPEILISEASQELNGRKVTLGNLMETSETPAVQILLQKLFIDTVLCSFAGNFKYSPLGKDQEIEVHFKLIEHVEAAYKTQWQVYNQLLSMKDENFALHQKVKHPIAESAAILREIHQLFPKKKSNFDWEHLENNEVLAPNTLQKLNKGSPEHIAYGFTAYLAIYPSQQVAKIIQFLLNSKIISSNLKVEIRLQAQKKWQLK